MAGSRWTTYFGWFGEQYQDHLFDITKLLGIFYTVSIPAEVSGDIDRLVANYFLEVLRDNSPAFTNTEDALSIAEPALWFAKSLKE